MEKKTFHDDYRGGGGSLAIMEEGRGGSQRRSWRSEVVVGNAVEVRGSRFERSGEIFELLEKLKFYFEKIKILSISMVFWSKI